MSIKDTLIDIALTPVTLQKNFNEQMKFTLQAEKEATDRGYIEPNERYEYIQQRVDELLGDYPND